MRRTPLLPAALVLLALAGCATGGPPHRGGGRHRFGPPGDMPRLFVSPAGEVFRGAPGEPPPIAAWFHEADADGNGEISFPEFQADFRRAFAAYDADHDGEIGPEEVARYETEIFPEMATRGGGFGGGGGGGPRMGGGGRRGGGMGGGMGGGFGGGGSRGRGGPPGGMAYRMSGAARFGLLPIAHPIMEADADFNRGVSRLEWDQAAATRFGMLDTAHNGRLTLQGLAAMRRGPPGR